MENKNNNPVADEQSNKLNSARSFVREAWAISVQVFTHRRFGERYLGLQAAVVILLVPVYCMLWQHADLRPMFLYLIAYLLHVPGGPASAWACAGCVASCRSIPATAATPG